jgi:NADH dehydrogenase (ubiquinone) 1 alpha subcomplex subunit 13
LAYESRELAQKREGEIMKNVKDWEVGKSVYNNPKYYTPNIRFA